MAKSTKAAKAEDYPGQTYGHWPKELIEATHNERPAPTPVDPEADNIEGHWLDCTRILRPSSKASSKPPDPA